MNAAQLDVSLARAQAVRDFRRGSRPRRRLKLYHAYLLLVLAGVGGTLGEHALVRLVGHGITAHQFLAGGPAVLLALAVLAVRFGSWHGPVAFSRPDVALLLTAPIAIAALVRPKLDHVLLAALLVGAVAAAVAVLVIRGGPTHLDAARILGTVVSGAAFAVGLVAISWLVESSRRSASWLRRLGPAPLLLAASVAALGWCLGTPAIWLGPWGWALAPLAGGRGWPVALVLLVCCSAAVVLVARRRVGRADAELFAARADVRASLGASAFTLDYRTAGLTYRAAAARRAGVGIIHLSAPRRARALLLWRDALALGYEQSRLLWASVLAVGATLEAVGHPGRLLPAALAAAAIYAAATVLSEPVRLDVDSPDRVRVLTSRPFARVLVGHAALPTAVLFVVTAATVLGTVLAGSVSAACLLLVPLLAAPSALIAALASVLAARRGGRVSESLLARLLAADPSNPGSALIIALWLAPFLAVTLAAVGVPLAVVGHAIAERSGAVVIAVAASAVMLLAAGWMSALGLRTRPPD